MQSLSQLGSFKKCTNDVEITVSPEYAKDQSDPEEGVFTFSYTVTMRNVSDEAIQLINRHWIVLSDGIQIADVKGEGVVGEQPVLEPGEEFEYTSYTTIVDASGSMYGIYTFYSESGEFFDAEIPRFELMYIDPDAIH